MSNDPRTNHGAALLMIADLNRVIAEREDQRERIAELEAEVKKAKNALVYWQTAYVEDIPKDQAATLPITSGDPQPCPMPGCGGKAVMAFYSSRNYFWIRCDRNIFHAGPHKESEAEALAAWNEPRSVDEAELAHWRSRLVIADQNLDDLRQQLATALRERDEARAVYSERVAYLTAHRACHAAEHDPLQGRIHGYCIVCGLPWPCDYAGPPPAMKEQR